MVGIVSGRGNMFKGSIYSKIIKIQVIAVYRA
jgi:hypothetical protein